MHLSYGGSFVVLLSASGGSCGFSSSGYWSFGASRTFMHGILVMAWVESKVAELAAFC
jgi:hypothetical protein